MRIVKFRYSGASGHWLECDSFCCAAPFITRFIEILVIDSCGGCWKELQSESNALHAKKPNPLMHRNHEEIHAEILICARVHKRPYMSLVAKEWNVVNFRVCTHMLCILNLFVACRRVCAAWLTWTAPGDIHLWYRWEVSALEKRQTRRLYFVRLLLSPTIIPAVFAFSWIFAIPPKNCATTREPESRAIPTIPATLLPEIS